MYEETVLLPALAEEPVRPRPRRPWRWLVLALVLALVAAVGGAQQSSRPLPFIETLLPVEEESAPDTDGDGLLDEVETAGWLGPDGVTYRTHPASADTDGDGLEDVAEADSSTDPLEPDSDRDGLNDFEEVEVHGTDPWSKDTDGDGFDDAFEVKNSEAQGLDAVVADVKLTKKDYAWDFAVGMVAGELWRKDSLAWLAGNLAGSGSSTIPGVGWITGLVFDTRDFIASFIKRDWVGAGFSATGVIPYAGDSVAVPAKVGAYVGRHPEAAVAVAAMAASLPKLSDDLRFKAVAKASPAAKDLTSLGASKKTVIKLTKGRTSLRRVADSMNGPGHVPGEKAPFMKDGPSGEKHLAGSFSKGGEVKTQAYQSTAACIEVCNATGRSFDALINGVAHESKVGYTSLTDRIRRQIESDAHLIATGVIKDAHWHFMASDVTSKMGPTAELVKLLNEKNIKYTIHLPK